MTRAVATKGDVPGHPFRGNQHTGGGSGPTPGNADEQALHEQISMVAKMQAGNAEAHGRAYGGIEHMLLSEGQYDKPQQLPAGIKRGRAKQCFANAYRLATRNPGTYTYVEGMATPEGIPIAMHHAWVVDQAGKVVDNTWDKPGTAYCGVHLSTRFVEDTAAKTGVYGVFDWTSPVYRDIQERGLPAGAKKEMSSLSQKEVTELNNKASQAEKLVNEAFDSGDWRSSIVNAALPIMAVAMAKSVMLQMKAMGVVIKPQKRRREKTTRLYTKTTTATDWLAENPDDEMMLEALIEATGVEGVSLFTELPTAVKQRIASALERTFSQDYWDEISETTAGAAEDVLRRGLTEGLSIRDMAKEIRESLGGGEYARSRAFNIARTESSYALNAARKEESGALQESIGDKIPMKQTWLSVLGTTTRPEHADLDGVPEDENGEWDLAGTKVKMPGDPVLGPEHRCNCQCSLSMEWGMQDDEARELIQDYYDRQAEGLEEASYKGGPNSGNFGHGGRPGQVGGSSPRGGAAQQESPVETSLRSAEVTNIEHKQSGSGAVNESKVVTLADGTKGLFKAAEGEMDNMRDGIIGGTYYRREAAAYEVAKIVGMTDMVPVTVAREINGQMGSLQHFVEDGTTANRIFRSATTHAEEAKPWDGPKDFERAAVFDYVIGNSDRHPGNWMVRSSGKLALIDHGLSLSTKPDDEIDNRGFVRKAHRDMAMERKSTTISEETKAAYRGKWKQIEDKLRASGIEQRAINRCRDRFSHMMRSDTLDDLWEIHN